MTYIVKAIKQHLPEAPKHVPIIKASLYNLVKQTDSKQFKLDIRTACKDSNLRVIDFQNSLSWNGFHIKNTKLFVCKFLQTDKSKAAALDLAQEYNIPEEVALYAKYVRNLDIESMGYSLDQMNNLLCSINEQLIDYTKKYSYKKLRFITMGSHISLEDICSELRTHALRGVLIQYPKFSTELHALNIAKTTVQRSGINMISSFTTNQRQSLQRESDGSFTNRKISLDCFEGNLPEGGLAQTLDGNVGLDFEIQYSLQQLVTQYKHNDLQMFKFLKLLLGARSRHFTRWLNNNTRVSKTNDELYYSIPFNKYLQYVCRYLNITPEQANQKLKELRGKL